MQTSPESSCVVAPDLLAIREARAFIARTLQGLHVTTTQIENAQLAISELACNALEHGARRPSHLEIRIRRHQDCLEVTLLEDGSRFTPDAVQYGNTGFEGESGRGLALVDSLFPDWFRGVEGSEEGSRNCSVLRIRVDDLSPAGGARVALVDDDPVQLALLSGYLKSDYKVSCFSDAAQLLAHDSAADFDLIVSDVAMPGLNGVDLRRQLQLRPELRSKPFVFLSGVDDDALRHAAMASGIDDFLCKPIDRRRLIDVIERVLARNRMLHEAIGSRLDVAITNTLRARVPDRIGAWSTLLHSAPGGPGGGDLVYFRRAASCDWLLLGDVMGHGIDAKFFAHAYAGHISGLAATMSDAAMPSDWLRGMTRSLAEDSLLERSLITCLVLRIERDGTIRIANAGHPCPLLCRGGSTCELAPAGPLLGLDPAADYRDTRLDPGPGRLVLMTDGLLEIGADPQARAATARAVFAAIASSAELAPAAALARVLDSAAAQAPLAPRDDLTLLMLDFDAELGSDSKGH